MSTNKEVKRIVELADESLAEYGLFFSANAFNPKDSYLYGFENGGRVVLDYVEDILYADGTVDSNTKDRLFNLFEKLKKRDQF